MSYPSALCEVQPSDTYLKKQLKPIYSESDVENTSKTNEQIKLCALCNLILYYPINTKCGHVYCVPCVQREFNKSNQLNTSSNLKIACNACIELLHVCDLRAGLIEAIAVLYNSVEVPCKNSGCFKNLTLGTLAKLEVSGLPKQNNQMPS